MIEDIEAREKAATPGPLELSIDGTYIWRTEAPAQLIARFENKVDARFYFHAREDILYLLAQLEEAREKLKATEAALIVDLDSIPEPTALHKDIDAMPPHLFAGTAAVCFWCGCGMDEEPHLDRILKGGD